MITHKTIECKFSIIGGGELERISVKRLGASRPKKGVKVIDLSVKRVVPKKPERKTWGAMPYNV
jgi:hypothetical protein